MPRDWSRGRTLSSRARGDTNELRGPLQRLLGPSYTGPHQKNRQQNYDYKKCEENVIANSEYEHERSQPRDARIIEGAILAPKDELHEPDTHPRAIVPDEARLAHLAIFVGVIRGETLVQGVA